MYRKKWRSSALMQGSKLSPRSLKQLFSFYCFSSFSLLFHFSSKNVLGHLEKIYVTLLLWQGLSLWRPFAVAAHYLSQGGHSSGKPGEVRELKSGQIKVRESELLQLFSCRKYCSKYTRYTIIAC